MIDILRKINGVETIIASVSNKNASHKQVIMGADEVSVGIVVSQFIDVKDGDYINHNGIVYTCNRDAEYTKSSDVNYQYNLLFEHPFYRLLDKLFTFPLTGSAVFTLTGKLVDFVDAVCWNMNYHVTNNPRGIDSGWTRGSVVDTDYLTLTFGSISCRDAITQIATAFNAEFFFSGSGKTINFVDHIENETGLIFVQGRGNGLYSVSQQNVDTKDTITRVYPVGGNQNVPNAYADEDGNLKLPELYLQNTSEYSRIVEKRVVFEDVFPHFVGDVESVAGTNNVELICSYIDFDLNEIAVGSNARINFLTGSLMGISFQFQFDFATKKVTLIPQNDDTALVNDDGTTPQVPQALKKAVIGDKFNFTGVVMPVQYVNASITKLREKGTTWLSFYSRKRVKFGLDIDYRWMRDKQALSPGDLVTIQIPERGVDKTIRISEINTNLYDGQLNATVSNYRDENWQKKVEGAISSLQTTVSGGGSGSGGIDILERYDERPASDRNVMSSLRSEKNFLRKDTTDTAAERITFDKGAVVRDLATKDFVQDKFAGAGAGIYEDSQGNSVMEVDKLNVRKEAWFNEIVINQIRFQGGIVVYSAATLEASGVADGGSYLQVYFDTKDGQLANQFAVDDQIRCQRFSGGNVIKYYMSRVTSIGTDYIRLSKTDIDGTLNVEVGDAIVQFGNRTNTARQSLIEVNVLDGGKQTFYQNVNSYSLTNKNYLELGRMLVDGQWKNMIRSYGGAYLGNRDLSSYIQYNETTGKIEIKASVEFLGVDGSYKTVDQAIGDIKIGGVNLIAGTKVANTQAAFANGVGYSFFAGLVAIANYGLAVGDYVTLSFDLANMPYGYLAGAAFTVEVNGSVIYVVGQTIYQSGQRATITYKLPVGATRIAPYLALNQAAIGAITMDYSKLKFEKGNKATDWSLAIEDVNASIAEAKQAGVNAQNSANTANSAVSGLNVYVDGAFKDGVIDTSEAQAIDKLNKQIDTDYSSVINDYNVVYANIYLDGSAKTNLLNAKINLVSSKDALQASINTAIADGKTTPAEKTDVNTKFTTYSTNFKAYQTALSNANKAIQVKLDSLSTDKVSNIQVGGRNLVLNSKRTLETSNTSGIYWAYFYLSQPLVSGKTYILTCGNYSMINSGKIFLANAEYNGGKIQDFTFGVPFVALGAIDRISLTNDGLAGRISTLTNPMLQLGNKSTDWSPAPEDVQVQIDASNAVLADITNDNKLTPNEKQQLKKEWDDIYNEFPIIREQANDVLGAADNYEDNYSYLSTYITPLLADLTTTSDIVGSTLRAKFRNYYYNREAVKDDIQRVIDIQSRSLDFMKSAVENGSAEFQGGLGLINLLFQKTLAGIVNGGMSGLEGDNVLNWGGSTYQQALADAAKAFGAAMSSAFLNKEDGSGHMAFGKIAWDMLGKLMVGNFEIKSGAIVGKDSTFAEKIKIHTGNLKTISELSNSWNRDASIYSWPEFNSGVYDWSNSFNYPVQRSKVYYVAGTFSTVENNTQVRLSAGTHNAVMNNATLDSTSILFKISKDGTVVATNSGNLSEIQIATAGNYDVSMLITITATIPANTGNASCDIDTIIPGYVEVQQAVARTEIAADGFMSYWSNLLHFYFSQSAGITYRGAIDIPAGLGGGRVSSTGSISGLWGILTKAGNGASKSGSDYTITHYIGNTDYSLILTPKSSNVPYFLDANRGVNTIIATCSGGFDFVLIRTK